MATLQIRDLPDPLHQLLQLRARRHHRSLSQQALSDLQQACGGDPRERRRQALADLQGLADKRGGQHFDPAPEELVDVIEPDRHLLAEALALACHLDHPVYDCLYLALARREAAVLVTADQRLQQLAARVLP